jgi:hypothetical protein
MPPGYGNNNVSLLLLLPVTAEAVVKQCYQRLAGSQPPIRAKYGLRSRRWVAFLPAGPYWENFRNRQPFEVGHTCLP